MQLFHFYGLLAENEKKMQMWQKFSERCVKLEQSCRSFMKKIIWKLPYLHLPGEQNA